MSGFSMRLLPGKVIRFIGIPLIRAIYRIRVVHPERVPQSGGFLLLPNHVTFADAFFITAACPRPVRFVMDEAFMASRVIRLFVSIFNTVTIRRDQPREAIRITIEALKNGDVVCLFPEGQLTRTGALGELRRGFELIAKKAEHPLVPLWCDGAWGSIFSFEGGRYFRKIPYRLPYPMTLAFGEIIPPQDADLEAVRNGLLAAATEAQADRFSAPEWATRIPRGDALLVTKFQALPTVVRRAAWANGHQIGQINALPRQQPFFILRDDPLPREISALTLTFPDLFDAAAEPFEALDPTSSATWVGGDKLREAIENASALRDLTFYDFGTRALDLLEKEGLLHLPCLALGGAVVSMSMPHPPNARGADPQLGHKPRSWGRLLPGWQVLSDENGSLRAHGPAAPPEGLPLPAGCTLDPENFLVAGDAT
jgi:acyl-[acyl-carrier-protein]-phospholipid O-acyltransferase / long-chain-fatty-acid--[acyl-carrier-protein] ligase